MDRRLVRAPEFVHRWLKSTMSCVTESAKKMVSEPRGCTNFGDKPSRPSPIIPSTFVDRIAQMPRLVTLGQPAICRYFSSVKFDAKDSKSASVTSGDAWAPMEQSARLLVM
jgi:hypothetical protein